jgi:RNA polymerase sigma-70 factor (ECF subfamily)
LSDHARESADLLRRAREGSREALGALLDRYAQRLLGLIRLRLGPALRDRIESRDVLQATLLKAIAGIDAFEGEGTGSLKAWLARIAANEIRDLADHHHRQRRDVGRTVPAGGIAEMDKLVARVRSETSRIALDEQVARLERALESLSPDHREVIILRKLEELSFSEIGLRMSRGPDACRMLLARAMAALTMRLGEPS